MHLLYEAAKVLTLSLLKKTKQMEGWAIEKLVISYLYNVIFARAKQSQKLVSSFLYKVTNGSAS